MNLMEKKHKLSHFWKEISFIAILCGMIFFTVSAFLPLEYKASASILIVQKDAQGLDAYKEVKSAEFTGKIIKEVLLSNSFMEGVASSDDKARRIIDKEKNPEDKLESWKDSFSISQVANTGVLNLSFFSGNREDSRSILNSIIENIDKEGMSYHGNPQIGIKIVNKPYALEDPSFPNLWTNSLAGIIFGVLVSILLFNFFPTIFLGILGKKNAKKNSGPIFISQEEISNNQIEEINGFIA